MNWLPFSFKDIIDIILFGLLIYYVFNALRKSGSSTLLLGIFALMAAWVIASPLLRMRLMGQVLDYVMGAGLLVLVILFQDDIRHFLNVLGSTNRWLKIGSLFKKEADGQVQQENSYIAKITFACLNMAKKKTGALICIEGNVSLESIRYTGEIINADVNSRLIEIIFFKNSPLHDGAMIIKNYRIAAAGCILPVSQGFELPKDMGLRHRAALGMSQQSDARIIIISEERGKISIAYRDEIITNVEADQLQKFLSSDFTDMSALGTIINAKKMN